jgi:hypothetical protein
MVVGDDRIGAFFPELLQPFLRRYGSVDDKTPLRPGRGPVNLPVRSLVFDVKNGEDETD